jgi:hypothetical protein
LQSPNLARSLGAAARAFVVENRSLARMVRGYEDLLGQLYDHKATNGYVVR